MVRASGRVRARMLVSVRDGPSRRPRGQHGAPRAQRSSGGADTAHLSSAPRPGGPVPRLRLSGHRRPRPRCACRTMRRAPAGVKGLLDRIEEQLRRLSHELRPTILDDLGLLAALEFLGKGFAARHRLEIHVHGRREERFLEPTETVLYRIVQEALNNVVKHAEASTVTITVESRRPARHLLRAGRRHRVRPRGHPRRRSRYRPHWDPRAPRAARRRASDRFGPRTGNRGLRGDSRRLRRPSGYSGCRFGSSPD